MTIRDRSSDDPTSTWAANKLKLVVVTSNDQYDFQGSIEQDQPSAGTMSNMTREELDARLELVEARADARLSRFEERIDQAIGEMRRDRSDLKGDIKSSKWTVVGTLIASVIAIVGGVAAFNATVLSNMVTSFESGKNTAQSISDATKRLESLQDRIEAAQKRELPPGQIQQVPPASTPSR